MISESMLRSRGKWNDVPGWTDDNLLDIYDDAVLAARPGAVFVEVGVAFGRSLTYLAEKVRESGKRIEIVGVDSWKVSTWLEEDLSARIKAAGGPLEAFHECIVSVRDLVEPWQCESVEAAHLAGKRWPGGVDFVFVDAAHDFESVLSDLRAWTPRVKPGGVIAGHDFGGDVERAVRAYFGDDFEPRNSCWRKAVSR